MPVMFHPDEWKDRNGDKMLCKGRSSKKVKTRSQEKPVRIVERFNGLRWVFYGLPLHSEHEGWLLAELAKRRYEGRVTVGEWAQPKIQLEG